MLGFLWRALPNARNGKSEIRTNAYPRLDNRVGVQTPWSLQWVARSEVIRRAWGQHATATPSGVPLSVPPNMRLYPKLKTWGGTRALERYERRSSLLTRPRRQVPCGPVRKRDLQRTKNS